MAVYATIEPGGSHTFEFQISWHYPNRVRSWSRRMYDTDSRGKSGGAEGLADGDYPVVRKRCARHADAWALARYTVDHLARA